MSRELFDSAGHRRYLTDRERQKFLAAADLRVPQVRTFCYVLAHTGCRISEALQLRGQRVNWEISAIVFKSLQKRKRRVFRSVPVPQSVLQILAMLVHELKVPETAAIRNPRAPLWDFGRTTAWTKVCEIMAEAGIQGPQATPTGLRHGFGVAAIQAGTPRELLQYWLGHAEIAATAMYANAAAAPTNQ